MECNVNMIDLVGYLAASLVFLAFFMKGIVPLRLIALGSNFRLICYAFSLHITPIVVLHLALIPRKLLASAGALAKSK
jgi:CRP/FNR family cyclic AMP-dependent transcriptional regulator